MALWLAAAALAANCRCNTEMTSPPPVGALEAPLIRVLLTSSPVAEARIGTTGGYRLRGGGQVLAESSAPLRDAVVRREGSSWRVGPHVVQANQLQFLPAEGKLVTLEKVAYRGSLRLVPTEGGHFAVINHLDLESYLAGVLSKELYPTWEPETYRALAVAARTFAMYHMITDGARSEYDLGDNQASQVYGGFSAETPRSRDAVRQTRGVVLASGPEGDERIFQAQYSACCGGRVNGAYVIRNAHRIEPLAGEQVCADCAACPRYRWEAVRVGKSEIYRALVGRYGAAAAALGGVRAIDIQTTTPTGRAVWVDVSGPNGKKIRLRAEDIRLSLIFNGSAAARKLYSMNCRMIDLGDAMEFRDGRGFGHGVGICQWGAQGKAARGWTAEQILAFYYPGAKLFRAY